MNRSIQEAQKSLTSNEFVELDILMDEEADEREPWMWYLAQIACEIAVTRTKKSQKIEDFLIKFKKPETKAEEAPLTEEQKAAYLQQSKNYWMGLLHKRAKKPPPQKKKTPPPVHTRTRRGSMRRRE